jgi:hypothetical protein
LNKPAGSCLYSTSVCGPRHLSNHVRRSMVFIRLMLFRALFHFCHLPHMDLRNTLANFGVQSYSVHSVPENTGPRIAKERYMRAAAPAQLRFRGYVARRGASFRQLLHTIEDRRRCLQSLVLACRSLPHSLLLLSASMRLRSLTA